MISCRLDGKISETGLYRLAGNSVVVSVLKAMFKELFGVQDEEKKNEISDHHFLVEFYWMTKLGLKVTSTNVCSHLFLFPR